MAASFHDVTFDDDFLTATRAGARALNFTRKERALLVVLAGAPGRLFTRAELYGALGSRGSDRNVDFVINRLRGKLGETAERRFIATQYGEGYIWVAAAPRRPPGGFLVVGHLQGGAAKLQSLRTALQRRLAAGREVVLAADLDPTVRSGFQFSVDASFHVNSGRIHAGFVLRRQPTHELVSSFRDSFDEVLSPEAAETLAAAIMDAIWKRLAVGAAAAPAAPADEPLHLRMHNASVLLDPPGFTWLINREQLEPLRAENPADATVAIMWAMNLFARTVLAPGPTPLTRAAVTAVDEEIEGLILPHVPVVRDDPVLALAAAKLLLRIKRGHEDLAESLALRAFASSAAFAAAFPMLGQVHARRGELAAARQLYDEGLRLCAPGSPFEVYLLILKATTYLAEGDHVGAEPSLWRIFEIDQAHRDAFGVLCLPPHDDGVLARTLAAIADRLDLPAGRRVIAYLHLRVADLFRDPEHAANIMRGPLMQLVRRLGPSVVPDELWPELAPEFLHLRRP